MFQDKLRPPCRPNPRSCDTVLTSSSFRAKNVDVSMREYRCSDFFPGGRGRFHQCQSSNNHPPPPHLFCCGNTSSFNRLHCPRYKTMAGDHDEKAPVLVHKLGHPGCRSENCRHDWQERNEARFYEKRGGKNIRASGTLLCFGQVLQESQTSRPH